MTTSYVLCDIQLQMSYIYINISYNEFNFRSLQAIESLFT
jgi:hypothetical protein